MLDEVYKYHCGWRDFLVKVHWLGLEGVAMRLGDEMSFLLILFIKERTYFTQQMSWLKVLGRLCESLVRTSVNHFWDERERSRLIKRKETAQHQRDVYLSNREQHSTSWCMRFRAEIRTLVSFCLSEQKSHFEKLWWGKIIVVCNCVNKSSYTVAELGSELYLNNCCISK